MSIPPRIEPGPPIPPDPAVQVASSHEDVTVHDVRPPPTEPGSGPPRGPLVLFAILIAVIVLGAVFWWISSQQSTQAAAVATATAVTQATATAAAQQSIAAQQGAANAQATAAAQSAAAASQSAAAATQQAAVASQATTTAQQAAVAVGTATAQTAAAAQAAATAQAVAGQATAAVQAARSAPTATPVVVVVTATAVPAPAPPVIEPGVVQPTVVQPIAPPPPSSGGQPGAPPVAGPAASPAAQAPADANVVRVTTAAGRPTQLRCLGERVTIMTDADALPPQVTLTCSPVAPASVPPPPNAVVNGTLFRLEVAPADGNSLKGEADVRITYPAEAVPSADRSKLVLGYLDGSSWTTQPDQTAEPTTTSITAKINQAGVYALYLKP